MAEAVVEFWTVLPLLGSLLLMFFGLSAWASYYFGYHFGYQHGLADGQIMQVSVSQSPAVEKSIPLPYAPPVPPA